MGNPDLAILIDGICFIIKGSDYDTREEAVSKAIAKFLANIEQIVSDLGEGSNEDIITTIESQKNFSEIQICQIQN